MADPEAAKRSYVPFPILDQLYAQKSIGPTPFSSEKLPNKECEASAFVQVDDVRDIASPFKYRMTYPATLHGVHYVEEKIRPSRNERNFFEQSAPASELQQGMDVLPAPNIYWQTPPLAFAHNNGAQGGDKGRRLPRDTLHPLISELQAQENAKAASFNPQVSYLSNASRKGPPCPAHVMKDKALPQGGAGASPDKGDDEEALDEDLDDMDTTAVVKSSKARHSRKGDPKTAVGRAYNSEGGFHDPEQYSSKIIEFAFTQPTTLTSVAAKAIAKALHSKPSHSIPANVIQSRHTKVEPNSGPSGTNANRYEFAGTMDVRNTIVTPSGGFRNLSADVKTALLKRTRDTRHRVAEILRNKYHPTQPPPIPVKQDISTLVRGESFRQPEQAAKKFGHQDSDDEADIDSAEHLPDDANTLLGDGSQAELWQVALRRKARRLQDVDESHLMPNHPISEVLGSDRKLRVITPEFLSVYNSGSTAAQFQRYLGGVGLRMAETLAQTKPPSTSSFYREGGKTKEVSRQFSDIAVTPNNTFGFDSNRLQMLLADKGDEVEDISLVGVQVTEAALLSIGTYCPGLRLLNVANCANLTDSTFQHIVERCNQLAYVNISGCKLLTGEAIGALFEHCPGLYVLVCSGLPGLDASSALAWSRLYQVPQLSFLDVSYCENLPDAALTSVAEHCRGLEGLDVSGCASVGDIGVASIGSSCTRLVRWRLKLCSQLTDVSLLKLSLAPRNLRSLDVSGCSLTSKTLESIVKHLPSLRNLSLGGCPNVDDEAVASITRHCSMLKVLNLSSCVGISLASCMLLIHELTQLQRLVVSESTISNAEVVMLSSLRETCKIVRNQYRPPAPKKIVVAPPLETKKKPKPAAKKGK